MIPTGLRHDNHGVSTDRIPANIRDISLTPAKKISMASEHTKFHADLQYNEVEKILKVAKDIASDLAMKLHPTDYSSARDFTEALAKPQVENREYGSKKISQIDRTSGEVPDYKLIISQRDAEIHTLRQNYEIQYQKAAILKQKLREVVESYEVTVSFLRDRDQRQGIYL